MMNPKQIFVLFVLAMMFIPAGAQQESIDNTIVDALVGENVIFDDLDFNGSNYYCFNPRTVIFCNDVIDDMYISLIGYDVSIGWYAPDQARSLAVDWEFSNNNQTLVIDLKDDLYWSDGTLITADDVMMSYELGLRLDANRDGEAGVDALNSVIASVEKLDDHTIQIRFAQGNCETIIDVNNYLKVLPAHIYRQLIDDVGYADLRSHEWFEMPTVVSGPFQLEAFVINDAGELESIIMLRNEQFTDNALGYVAPERYIIRVFQNDDRFQLYEQFLDGEIDIIAIEQNSRSEMQALAEDGTFRFLTVSSVGFDFMALNAADPMNPQPALDADGERIEQGIHPIFGDTLVRQALWHSIDVEGVLQAAYGNNAVQMPSYVVPNAWPYDYELPPVAYDRELALSMLAEAGWVPENSDLPASASNRLICQDCLYARTVDSDYNGAIFEFEGLVESGTNPRLEQADAVQSDLEAIGISMTVTKLEFATYVEQIVSQTYDAGFIGLGAGNPFRPGFEPVFGAQADAPGQGLNVSSFYNEGFYALTETAQTVAGCGLTERINISHRMQEIIQDDVPFIFFGSYQPAVAVQNNIEGVDPAPLSLTWNLDTWQVTNSE